MVQTHDPGNDEDFLLGLIPAFVEVRKENGISSSVRAPFFSPKACRTILAGKIVKWLQNPPPTKSR